MPSQSCGCCRTPLFGSLRVGFSRLSSTSAINKTLISVGFFYAFLFRFIIYIYYSSRLDSLGIQNPNYRRAFIRI